MLWLLFSFFFFKNPARSEIYTLSLHDALPICGLEPIAIISQRGGVFIDDASQRTPATLSDDASLRSEEQRLNSSHTVISYAVFCLKKKKAAAQLQPYVKNVTTESPWVVLNSAD